MVGHLRYLRKADPDPPPAWLPSSLLTWAQIANTNNSSVDPDPPVGVGGFPSGKIDEWGTLSLRLADSSLWLGPGGGHAGYYGNEIDKIVLSVDVPAWEEALPPSADADILTNSRRNADGKVPAMHQYYDRMWNNVRDELWAFLPASPQTSDQGYPYVERFDYATNAWLATSECPEVAPDLAPGSSYIRFKSIHPTTGDVYFLCNNGAGNYDVLRCNSSDFSFDTLYHNWPYSTEIYGASCINPVNGTLLIPQDGTSGAWQLMDTSDGTATTAQLTGSFPTASMNSLMWDSIGERFLLMQDDGTLYEIDPSTWACAEITISGTPPTTATNGLFNKAQFIAALKGIAMVTAADENVHFVRLYS